MAGRRYLESILRHQRVGSDSLYASAPRAATASGPLFRRARAIGQRNVVSHDGEAGHGIGFVSVDKVIDLGADDGVLALIAQGGQLLRRQCFAGFGTVGELALCAPARDGGGAHGRNLVRGRSFCERAGKPLLHRDAPRHQTIEQGLGFGCETVGAQP